jgi:YidC/Oxa1 family membrane protein insertase
MMLPLANVLQPLIDFSEGILKFFHNTVGFGWGLSIIFLTFVIRLIILPLTFRQVRSMQALQRLQPEIKKLQARYKDDRQRLNQEMMKFYQEHKVNPLSSCLPVLLQLPFFLALFYMLRHDLRMDICGQVAKSCGAIEGDHGQKFLFIKDITDNATGAALIVLIVLYVGSQLPATLPQGLAT